MAAINVITEKCTGCGVCLSNCPFNAIELKEGTATIGMACTLCGACAEECPCEAIDLTKEDEAKDDACINDIWVFCEEHNGRLRGVGPELLGKGRSLANQVGATLTAVLFTPGNDNLSSQLIAKGADRVLLSSSEVWANPNDLAFSDYLTDILKKYRPRFSWLYYRR